MRPFVLLEVGNARVTPYVERDLSSFVHDHLIATGQVGGYDQNAPNSVRVVHPLVTLVEKLDALQRRVGQDDREPASFVRHFEDAARIIEAETTLPTLDGYDGPRSLANEMLAEGQIRAMPSAQHPAFTPDDSPRWDSVRSAYVAIAPMCRNCPDVLGAPHRSRRRLFDNPPLDSASTRRGVVVVSSILVSQGSA